MSNNLQGHGKLNSDQSLCSPSLVSRHVNPVVGFPLVVLRPPNENQRPRGRPLSGCGWLPFASCRRDSMSCHHQLQDHGVPALPLKESKHADPGIWARTIAGTRFHPVREEWQRRSWQILTSSGQTRTTHNIRVEEAERDNQSLSRHQENTAHALYRT